MKFKLSPKMPKVSEYLAKVSNFLGKVHEYFIKMARLSVEWFSKFEKSLFTRVLRVICTVLLPVILLTSFFVFDGEDYWESVFLVWVLSIPAYFVLFLLSKIVDGKSLVIKLSMSDLEPGSESSHEREVFKDEQSDELSDDWKTPEPVDNMGTTVSRFPGREYKELADAWGLDMENDREAIKKHLDKVLLMGEESVNKHAKDIRDFLLAMAREEKRLYGKTYTFYKGLYDISDDRSLIMLVRRLLYELYI
ncbi:hypothetical protein [Thermoactinomyces mirandus]|uniref:Uncharacterized protein n=1 Tax=Thermoactinomyces mirandus TaxID=2756294 RepID=A0A7W2ASI7_9BACL|nr:hypothetical protein [Thermoactinomyces mirandus]MBA4602705.1 hypothetical protein [Thermoactinomyces mirandus]